VVASSRARLVPCGYQKLKSPQKGGDFRRRVLVLPPCSHFPSEEIEEPSKRFTGDDKTNDLLFLVQWGPVQSNHCVAVAQALERAYAHIA
jgi:hypothetical protein